MIKKIMSVIASIVMIGSTLMFASAASTSGGMFGHNTNINAPGPLDAPAANVMNDYIASLNISETNQTVINGEKADVKTSSQPLYLGDVMSATKSVFTETQLPNVLATGEVTGDDGKDYEYNLKINIPNVVTKYGEAENNLDKAIIYSDFQNDEYYDLRIIFPTAVNISELAGETITLFGKQYTFSEDKRDLNKNSITLFEQSNSIKINSGETKTVNGHNIMADIEDTDTATLYVDGVSKSVNDNDWSGKINGVDIYVKNIVASNIEGGARYIQISLNAEKLVLSNTDEVELGTSSIDGTNVVISPSGEKVSEIKIRVTPNNAEINGEDNLEYVGLGESFIDPVFKTIKFSLDSVTPGLTSSERDYIKLKKSGDKGAIIKFTNKAGKEYNFNFIEKGSYNLVTANIKESDYFITGSGEYSQIWKVERITNEEIRLRDQGKNSDSITLSLVSSGTADLPLADGGSATINRQATDNIVNVTKIEKYVYTENGAKIEFIKNPIYTNGSSNYIGDNYSVNIIEETIYNGGTFTDNKNNQLGNVININIINPTSNLRLNLISGYNYSYSDDNDHDYAITTYGTYIDSYNDERLEIYYPENAMQVNFGIGEVNYQITNVLVEGKVSQVILGGSCINQAAADILGIGRLCGSDFTTATGIGENQAMIKTFAKTDGKIAILVAGYETADTLRGTNYLKNNPTEFNSVGVSKII